VTPITVTADRRRVIIFDQKMPPITVLEILKAFFLRRRTVFLRKSALQPVFSVP
jgi:hypothetical protein